MMYSLLGLLLAAGSVWAQDPFTNATDANGNTIPVYSPARPPAIPLAVRSPYTSVWSTTADNGTLNSNSVMFWTGQSVGWEGIITVDGISYEWLGTGLSNLPDLNNIQSAKPLTVSYDSQYSNFTFSAGPLELTASFFSPVTPQDLCRTSIPLSYLQVSYVSTDNASHSVQLYGDVDSSWNNYAASSSVDFALYSDSTLVSGNATGSSSSVFSWIYHLAQEYVFSELNDFSLWGNFTYSTSPGSATNFTYQSGDSVNLRYNYIMNHYLADTQTTGNDQIFAYSHDFGRSSSGSVLYTVGTVQQPQINILTNEGLQSLEPWWSSSSCFGSNEFNLIAFHYEDFSAVQGMGAQYESRLKADVDRYYAAEGSSVSSTGVAVTPPTWSNATTDDISMTNYINGTDQYGEQYIFDSSNAYGFLDAFNFTGIAIPDVSEAESYYSIVALSTRQIMAAYVLTIPPDFSCGNASTIYNSSEPFMFQKEISSNGNMNTVDVLYPAMPFFLYSNPNLLRYALNPLFLNQESGFYPRTNSMHDLGTNFPNATGHVAGDDESMPVEESGNMLLMAYAIYKFTGNAQWLELHYSKLYQWAQFLIEYSLIPADQLSTDDFLGTLANQTNLAIKGIVGLQAMAGISIVTGHTTDAANFSATAIDYYSQWEDLSIDPTHTHTVLAYQWRSSWGLLYNSYPDKLLNLGVVSQAVYDMQSDWYPRVSQIFGVPLDNRHSLTKSDWEMWTAATCSPKTRRLFVNALAYWLNHTSTNLAFTDLYDTIDTGGYPIDVTFVARPVAGGHFSLLAMLEAGIDSTTGTSPGGFPANSTQPLNQTTTLPISAEITPTAMPTLVLQSGVFSSSYSVVVSSTISS